METGERCHEETEVMDDWRDSRSSSAPDDPGSLAFHFLFSFPNNTAGATLIGINMSSAHVCVSVLCFFNRKITSTYVKLELSGSRALLLSTQKIKAADTPDPVIFIYLFYLFIILFIF